jgi:hypothetical protein
MSEGRRLELHESILEHRSGLNFLSPLNSFESIFGFVFDVNESQYLQS